MIWDIIKFVLKKSWCLFGLLRKIIVDDADCRNGRIDVCLSHDDYSHLILEFLNFLWKVVHLSTLQIVDPIDANFNISKDAPWFVDIGYLAIELLVEFSESDHSWFFILELAIDDC